MPNPLARNKPYVREENTPYAQEPLAVLDCVVERVTYHNAENGYSVLKVMQADVKDKVKADLIPVIGSFQSPKEGECLRVYGVWTKHPQHGSQLKAERYETLRPATAAAMEKYLGSGMVKGIGPKMAERIIKKFGDKAFDVIENHPDKLATVQGIGMKRVEMIQRTWQEQKEIRNVMTFLQSHGITPTYALKIYRKYKDRSIEIVEQNPYQLAQDIWGIGFKSADKIAQNLGIALDAPERLEAGLVFVLNDQMESGGHCFLPREELIKKACEILLPQTAPEGDEVPDQDLVLRANSIEFALDKLIERELLVAETINLLGAEETAIYTPSIFATEKAVAERVHTLLNSPWRSRLKPAEIDAVVQGLPGAETLSDEQMQAVRRAISEPVMVLTGGPGTGKCVTGDTLVLGSDGFRYIQEHWGIASGELTNHGFPRSGLESRYKDEAHLDRFADVEPDTFLPYEITVAARNGLAQTSHVYFGGRRETIRVRTSLGLEIEGTPNHRIWAMTEHGSDWVRLDNLQMKHKVAVRYGDELWAPVPFTETAQRFDAGRTIANMLQGTYAKNRPVLPAGHYAFLIFNDGRRRTVRDFRSMLQHAATQNPDGTLTLPGKDSSMLRGIQLAFLNLGILARLCLDENGGAIHVPSGTIAWLQETETQTVASHPEIHWDTVESLTPSSAEVFDLSVPGEESFVANGFINHNTTTTRVIIEAFAKLEKRLQIASPTGRAAKRATEVTGREAKTIHRLLAYDPEKNDFKHGPGEPLELDVLVIDESSMLDLVLTHKTLRAVPDGAQVIFVGDVDQLPSVGPGNVLSDLINSGRVPVARLTQVFRQAAQSKIITNAHAINKGKIPELLPPSEAKNGADCVFIEIEDPEEGIEKIKGVVAKSLPRMGFAPDAITVLTPMQRGSLGGKNLNEILQNVLNPASPTKLEHMRGPVTFRVGDRVMQRRNNYDKNVFNGDVGNIIEIDPEEQTLAVQYPEQVVLYDFPDTDEIYHSFANTIHKSQGSEYPACIIVMANQHYTMLQRNLLYTGLTRAKKMAVLIGSKWAMKTAINNRLVTPRFTRLAERLQNLVEALSSRQRSLPDGGANGLVNRDLSHPPLPGRLL